MIHPRGELIHRNLSSDYTDVPQLLSSLTSDGFAGVVEVQGKARKGVFLLGGGKIINAALKLEEHPEEPVGQEAIEQLLSLSSEPGVLVNVYRMAQKEVELLAGTLNCEVVFRNLSTDFVRFDRFIQKLTDEKHTGYIEIFTKENQPVGILSLKDGEVAGFLVTGESPRSSFFEQKAVPALLSEFGRQGVLFTVYKAIPNAQVQKHDANGSKQGASPGTERRTGSEERTTAKTTGAVEQAVVNDPEYGRNEFLAGLQKVFTRIDKFLDGISRKGAFQRAFKRACIEKADSYPFLDPFEGLFGYENGEMRLDVGVPVVEFAAGVADCLNITLSYIQKELPGNVAFPPGLKGEIEYSFRHYQDIVRSAGIRSPVPPGIR